MIINRHQRTCKCVVQLFEMLTLNLRWLEVSILGQRDLTEQILIQVKTPMTWSKSSRFYRFFSTAYIHFQNFASFFQNFTHKYKNCTKKIKNGSHFLQNYALHSKYHKHVSKANICKHLCHHVNCVSFIEKLKL